MKMLQRATFSCRATDDDHFVIDLEQPPLPDQEFRKWRVDLDSDSDSESGDVSGKKVALRERLATRSIHCVPIIVFLCFFALWWFSAPANLVIKDGRVVEGFDMRMSLLPLSFNATHVELASLASATPPVSQNLTRHNGTEKHIAAVLEKKPKNKARLKRTKNKDSTLHFHNKIQQQIPKNKARLKRTKNKDSTLHFHNKIQQQIPKNEVKLKSY